MPGRYRTYALKTLFSVKKSIQAKVFLAFIVVTFFSISSVGLILYVHLTNNIKENAVDYELESMRHADENLQIMLKDIEMISTVLVTNEENVRRIIQSEHFEISYDWFQEEKRLKAFLSSLKAYKSYISRITVLGTNGKIFYEGAPRLTKAILQDTSVGKILEANGTKVWIKKNGDNVLWYETVTLGRSIKYEKEQIGVVMIDIDYDVIRKTYNFGASKGSSMYVIERDGTFVYKSNTVEIKEERIQDSSLYAVHALLKRSSPVSRMMKIDGQSYLLASYTSSYTGWTTIGLIPEKALLQDTIALRNKMMQIALFVFVIVFVASLTVARQITKNLRKLQRTMHWVREGNLTVQNIVRSEDEVGELNKVFLEMIDRLKGLMSDMKRGEEQKREAELSALQAQISPHFLYNTLNTIKYLARLRNAPNIEEVTGALITLLRGVGGNTKQYIRIAEEVEYARSYIAIQKYKYIDQMEVSWQVDPELLECMIMKLLLQPIIENAIVHGIGPSEQGGLLKIKIQRDGPKDVKLEVTDNGQGMTKEQIAEVLRKNVLTDQVRFSGMGVANVHERIRLTYGEPYGVRIFSEPGLFTTVEITIPVIREGGGDVV